MTNSVARTRPIALTLSLVLAVLITTGCCSQQKAPCAFAGPPPRFLDRQLAERKAAFQEQAPPETAEAFEKGIRDAGESEVMQTALRVGDRAPDFTLPNAEFRKVTLSDLLEHGPVVIVWHRGGWCPYCNIQLRAYQSMLPRIEATGATLLAISPELPDKTVVTANENELSFEVLSDVGNRIAGEYGLVYTLSPGVRKFFKGRIDFGQYYGEPTPELPLSATYVIDKSGVIRYAFVEADYRVRAEPADVIAVLQNLAE